MGAGRRGSPRGMNIADVTIDLADASLPGDLALPDDPAGVVLFAHGSGSCRHSPRNRAVAAGLNDAGIGTLLIDLLTAEEGRATPSPASCASTSSCWPGGWSGRSTGSPPRRRTADCPVGLFGASTGAAAALVAAARRPERVTAVVSRGGRPDLAGDALERVARARRC